MTREEYIEAAKNVLEAYDPVIGKDGPTLTEMRKIWDKGSAWENDNMLDTIQHAWLLLKCAQRKGAK